MSVSKTSEIPETTATDTTNQTPEQETGNATSSPTSISTPISQTPIADYVRKVVNAAFELQKKNFEEIENCVDLKIGLRADFKSNFYALLEYGNEYEISN